MTFFTGLVVFIAALLGYMFLFVIGLTIMYGSDYGTYIVILYVGIVLSLLLAIFICTPESYGYQKITVSENVVEVSE